MSTRKTNSSAGFTIAEMLITLAIMGLLLTAVAIAFNASVINYQENEKAFHSINAARQALTRMTSQIRTGYVDPNNIANEQICQVFCADGSQIRYHYESADKKLYLYDFSSGSDYTLCENVNAITFKKDNNTSTGDVKSVRISITVSQDNIEQKLSAAAVVRKVLEL